MKQLMLMHRMRGYVRVVLLPVAVTFLAFGQQLACASPADLNSAPNQYADATAVEVHYHAEGMTHNDGEPGPDSLGHDCPHCLGSGDNCASHAESECIVVSVSDGNTGAVLGSITKLDDLTKLVVLPVAVAAESGELIAANALARTESSPCYGPVPTYLRYCSFLE